MEQNIEMAFRVALSDGSAGDVQAILAKYGSALAKVDCGGGPGLVRAAGRGDIDIVRLLLTKEYGFDVNAEERFPPRLSALEISLRHDNPELVKLLLEHGADPKHGRTILLAVTAGVRRKKNAVVLLKLLEEYGADLNQVFTNEQSPRKDKMNVLSLAMANGYEDVVTYLRSRGVALPGKR